MHAELKAQGKLIVDGGNGKLRSGAASSLGGGATSPAGRLPLKTLSLRRDTKVEMCAETNEHAMDITIL